MEVSNLCLDGVSNEKSLAKDTALYQHQTGEAN